MEAWRQIPRIAGVLALAATFLWMLSGVSYIIYLLISGTHRRHWGLFLGLALMAFVMFAAAYFIRLLWRRIYANADAELARR